MGNEVSTVGGSVAVVGTAVAAGVTFGQVPALNNAVKETAQFTGDKFMKTNVRHLGETGGLAIATGATAVAAGVCLGQVSGLNNTTAKLAQKTSTAGRDCGAVLGETLNDTADGLPVVGHLKGGIHHACGDHQGGEKAMKAASRTTCMVGGAVGGFCVAGPVGAAAGGVAGGAAMDGAITGVDSARKRKFTPYGQIAAWTKVARADNAQDRIDGIVSGVAAPVTDAFAGYSIGRTTAAVVEKVQSVRAGRLVAQYLEEGGNADLFEAIDAADRVPAAGKVAPPQRPEDAQYDGNTVPEEGWHQDGETVYRGDKRLETHDGRQHVFQDGMEPHGGGNHGADAQLHTEHASYHQQNYVSTSESYALAKEFGKCGNHRRPRAHVLAKVRVVNGVNIVETARILGVEPLYPGQFEISSYGGVSPSLIEGVLVMPNQGPPVWHPNPDFQAPTVGMNYVYYIRQSPAVPAGMLVKVAVNAGESSDDEAR